MNSAWDPLVCTIHGKNSTKLKKKKKKKREREKTHGLKSIPGLRVCLEITYLYNIY